VIASGSSKMTRRLSLFSIAGILTRSLKSNPAGGLLPLNEQTFRQMVASHRGQVLLVDFWATWCAPCREELPKLVGLATSYRQKGLNFLTVSCDEPEQQAEAAAFVQRQGAPAPYYIRRAKDDDQFINSIDTKWSGALPALFLFDRTGRQALSFIGETDMNQLEATIKKLLAS
jgi:thiol-disulfide isomerase/thioredoxin